MKLYCSPPMASLGVLILAYEMGTPIALAEMDAETRRMADGRPLAEINPKNCLPVLERDDGSVITETPVMLDWLAAQDPQLRFTAACHSETHLRIMEWMVYFATEQHKLYTFLFWPIDDTAKAAFQKRIIDRFALAERALASSDYLVGNRYTIADIYLLLMVRGAMHLFSDFDLETDFPHLADHRKRLCARPAVERAAARHGGGV